MIDEHNDEEKKKSDKILEDELKDKAKPDGTKILGTGIAKQGATSRKKALTRSEREMKRLGL